MSKIHSGALRATILVAASLVLTGCEEEPPEVVEKVRAIKTITVAERGSGQVRRFPGIVEAVDTSILSFEVAGNTREINVTTGDRVTQGQVLATLDPTPFQLNVEAAEAEVGRTKAVLAEKDNDFNRQDTLFKKDWVSKAALDQALAARDSAKNGLSFAASKLNLAKRDLEKTELVAPFDGVIAAKHADPFQEVARGEKIFDIYIEGAMEVVLSIPETQIGDLYLGLPAEVTFPADRIEPTAGRVSEIGSSASEANAFPVKVALVDAPASVLPGMTAEASLLLGGEDDETTYLIPFSAIAPGEESGRGYVFVFDQTSSTVTRRPVRGAGVRDNRVLISEGIAAGDIVAVAGVSFLRDGQKVKLLSN
jgi:RND family efflux transporter MFP subunit